MITQRLSKLELSSKFKPFCNRFPYWDQKEVLYSYTVNIFTSVYLNLWPLLTEEAHLNTSFKHFIYFVQEFQEKRLFHGS